MMDEYDAAHAARRALPVRERPKPRTLAEASEDFSDALGDLWRSTGIEDKALRPILDRLTWLLERRRAR